MVGKLIIVTLTVFAVSRGVNCEIPDKVFFQAWNSETVNNIPAGADLVYDKTNSNNGNYYDSTTGKFKVPRDGPYVFAWNVVTQAKYSLNAVLYVNEKKVSRAQADGSTGPQNSSGSNIIVLNLKEGDIVNLRCGDWRDQEKRQFYGGPVSTFAGWAL